MCCSNNDNQNSFSPCFTSWINHMLKLGALLMICGVWWFIHIYIHVCSIWNMHFMIMLEINWQLHYMRKCKTHVGYHMRLIHHRDFSLESQCPSACINYCFPVPSLWATEASFFRHKESIFVKWGMRLTHNEMYELYLLYSLLALVHTYMSSQPFNLLYMPSVCYEYNYFK